jgi:ATP-dependent protease ClpP protease subunit
MDHNRTQGERMTTASRIPVFAALQPGALRDRIPAFAAGRPPAWRMETDDTADSARIHLYGAIGGFWGDVLASDLVPRIRDITASTIELFINSPGGDVYDAIAIRNALRNHSARVVVTVDGLAASAATIVATGGDEIVMGNGAEMMIHEAWTIAIGSADDFRLVADDLDRICANIAQMYADKAGGDPDDWRALMRAETWYSADEAVEAGLADRTDSAAERDAAAAFDLTVFAHAGRAHAPAPRRNTPAAQAPNKEETEMNRAQLAAALAAGTITQAEHDAQIAVLEKIEAASPTQPPAAVADPAIQAALEQGPQAQGQPAPHLQLSDRPLSLRQFSERMASSVEEHTMAGRTPLLAIQNALADVLPADDAGGAFVNREDYIGEVWRAEESSRPWVDAVGTPEAMTTLKRKGWRWGKDVLSDPEDPESDLVEIAGTPDVDEYEGNKEEVPSNEVGTKEVEFGWFRVAAGWDVDRVYFDFFEADFWESFTRAATANYKRKSNASVRTRILAAATDTPDADASYPTLGINGVLKQLRRDIRSVGGASANRVFLGETLFDALEDLDTDHLPLWLKNADIGLGEDDEDQATVGKLRIRRDSTLGDGDSVVFDNRGWRIFERAPFWLQALVIAKGGVDVGVFSYLRLEEHDDRVTVKRTYALT